MAQYADSLASRSVLPEFCAMKMMFGEMEEKKCLPNCNLSACLAPGRTMDTPTAFPFQRDLHFRVTGYIIQCNIAR